MWRDFAHAQIANLSIEHFTLPNGMEVILHMDHKAPLVHLNFRYRVGAKHEKAGTPASRILSNTCCSRCVRSRVGTYYSYRNATSASSLDARRAGK